MDVTALKRDPTAIHNDLKTLNNDTVITEKGCRIYIPEKYQDSRLVTVGVETYILGLFGIVVGNQYGVSMAPTQMRIEPDVVQTVKIDDVEYLEFTFEPKSVVIANVNVVQDNQLLYSIYNEFISKGNVPWYFNYKDLGDLFELSKYYTGTKLGANHVIPEIIVATISRNPENLKQHYRHTLKTPKDLKTDPKVVKLNSVTYGATNTTTKLIGAYYGDGINSALVHPSTKEEPIEEVLRR